jgi:hypothetical protein
MGAKGQGRTATLTCECGATVARISRPRGGAWSGEKRGKCRACGKRVPGKAWREFVEFVTDRWGYVAPVAV